MRLIGLVLALGLTLAPLAAEAQQGGKIPLVGVVSGSAGLEIVAKQLELLKETVPKIRRVTRS
jgi:putative tryptophan/tyrosine transport system substrate-binding protein